MTLSNIYYLHEIGGKKNQEDYIWPAAGSAALHDKIFIVCDGVGGSENGEVASRMIAEYVGKKLLQTAGENISLDYINELLFGAKQQLVAHANNAGLNKDMATTFSLLVLFSNKAFVAWCGDSRVYHVRKSEILYKTSDHSLVNTLVKNGEITEEEALVHPQKHIILKAINGDDTAADADGEWINNIADGDYFMLCTDGLLENISDTAIKTLLADNTDIIQKIQERCYGKTRDNYSMYLVQISLQAEPAMQKTTSSYGSVWLIVLAAVLVAGGLLFFNKKEVIKEPVPAAVSTDTIVIQPSPAIVTAPKDSIGQQAKDLLLPVKPLQTEDAGEKKIVPAPLPETKQSSDSPGHKKALIVIPAGSVQLDPQDLQKKKKAAEKKDSSLHHEKPLN